MSNFTYSSYNLSPEEFQQQANHIMGLLEAQAFKDGLITEEDAFTKRYSVVLVKPGMFSRWFDRVFMKGVSENAAVFKVFKNPDPSLEDDEDEASENA